MGNIVLANLQVSGVYPSLQRDRRSTRLPLKNHSSKTIRWLAVVVCFGLTGCVSSSPQVTNLADVGQLLPAQSEDVTNADNPNGIVDPDGVVQPAENSQTAAAPANSDLPTPVPVVDPSKQHLLQTAEGVLVAVPIRNPNTTATQLALASSDPQSVDATQGPTNNQVSSPDNNNQPTLADPNNPASPSVNTTTELALLTPQKTQAQNSGRAQFNNDDDDGSGTRQAVVTTPSTRAVRQQATRSLNRPSFLARLFKRPKVDVGATDDRKSPILRSSRTASRANQPLNSAPALTVGTSVAANGAAIPGVRIGSELFGTKPRQQAGVQVASAASLARLSPKSLKTQHSRVNVDCITPKVIAIINLVEQRYGKQPVVTSGYRSPSRNRRAGGARNSMHIYCKAADIQVEGVSKWNLAKFMRTIPGRGGIGTYCRTKSVHIDTGPKRDWHHSCRRKSKKRRNKA